MAASDKDLEKRTRELAGRRGGDLADYQAIGNQIQAIQDQRKQNLALERAAMDQDEQSNSMMLQAGEIASMAGSQDMQVNPQTQQLLGKYGLGQPKVQRTQGRSVKVVPNNIVINNNYNTTTTNNVAGGSMGSAPRQADPGQSKFKTWVSNAFAAQKEQSLRRSRDFDRREWSLTKSANKMLRKMESVGKEMMTTFNPKEIGNSVGGQFKTLLMLFGVTFLAKHWTKVLKAITWVGEKIKGGLDYFGVGVDGNSLARMGKGFRADFISFFGGDVRKGDTVGTALMRVGKDLIDYLKMKLDHGFEERGAAMKAIKFPDIDLSNIGLTLSSMAGYLGNILTAMVDPKKGIQNALKTNISTQGIKSSNAAMQRDMYNEYTTLAKNTDAGDLAAVVANRNGQKKYSLMKGALDSSGNLTSSVSGQISQGRDIMGAYRDAASTGKIDTARVAAGFSRMEDYATKNGGVTVDRDFVQQMFGSDAGKLIRSGMISTVRMKAIRVPKTEEDYTGENARSFLGAATQMGVTDGVIDATGLKGFTGFAAKSIANSGVTKVNNPLINAIDVASPIGWGRRLLGNTGLLGAINGEVTNAINRATANGYKYKLVPYDDPHPGEGFYDFYSLSPEAIRYLASRIYRVKSFKEQSIAALGQIQNSLLRRAGGVQAASAKWSRAGKDPKTMFDVNINEYSKDFQEFENLHNSNLAEENAFWANSSMGAIENNSKRLGNSIVGGINTGIEYANKGFNMIGGFVGSLSTNQHDSAGARWGTMPGRVDTRYGKARPFFVADACRTLERNVRPRSAASCAMYVRLAVEAGLHLPANKLQGVLGNARDFARTLGKVGFAPVDWQNWKPQPGDILAQQEMPGHAYGHVSMFSGRLWMSDYLQKNMWGGINTGYHRRKQGVILRHINRVGANGEPLGDTDSGNYGTGGTPYLGSNYNDTPNTFGGFGSGGYNDHIGGVYGGGGGYAGGGSSFSGGGGYAGGGMASAPSYGFSSPVTVSAGNLKADRASFWKEHRAKWYSVLKQRGMSEEDAGRLSSFFTAQDGYESAGGTSPAARNQNNFGGMQRGGKNITYGSVQDYMNAKLNMFLSKFRGSLAARDFGTFIMSLGRTPLNQQLNNNGGQIYYEADPYTYLKGAASYLGDSNSVSFDPNAAGNAAGGGFDVGGIAGSIGAAWDSASTSGPLPTIGQPFDVKSDAELAKEKQLLGLKGEAGKLWKQNQIYLKERGVKDYNAFEKYWVGLDDKGRLASKKRVAAWNDGRTFLWHRKKQLANISREDINNAFLGFDGEGSEGGIAGLNTGVFGELNMSPADWYKVRKKYLALMQEGRYDEAMEYIYGLYKKEGYKGSYDQIRTHLNSSGRRIYHQGQVNTIQNRIDALQKQLESEDNPEKAEKLRQQIEIEKARRDALGKSDIYVDKKNANNNTLKKRLQDRNKKVAEFDGSIAAIEKEKELVTKQYKDLIEKALDDNNIPLATKLHDEAYKKMQELDKMQKNFESEKNKFVKSYSSTLEDAKTQFSNNKGIFDKQVSEATNLFNSFVDGIKSFPERIARVVSGIGNALKSAWNTASSALSNFFSIFGHGGAIQANPDVTSGKVQVRDAIGGTSNSEIEARKKRFSEIPSVKKKLASGDYIVGLDPNMQPILMPKPQFGKSGKDGKTRSELLDFWREIKKNPPKKGSTTKPDTTKQPGHHATGGFTRVGDTGQAVGYVHEGEWIAPKKMVDSNKDLFRVLDQERISTLAGRTSRANINKDAVSSRAASKYEKISAAANQVSSAYMSELVGKQDLTNQLLSKIVGNTAPKKETVKTRGWTK